MDALFQALDELLNFKTNATEELERTRMGAEDERSGRIAAMRKALRYKAEVRQLQVKLTGLVQKLKAQQRLNLSNNNQIRELEQRVKALGNPQGSTCVDPDQTTLEGEQENLSAPLYPALARTGTSRSLTSSSLSHSRKRHYQYHNSKNAFFEHMETPQRNQCSTKRDHNSSENEVNNGALSPPPSTTKTGRLKRLKLSRTDKIRYQEIPSAHVSTYKILEKTPSAVMPAVKENESCGPNAPAQSTMTNNPSEDTTVVDTFFSDLTSFLRNPSATATKKSSGTAQNAHCNGSLLKPESHLVLNLPSSPIGKLCDRQEKENKPIQEQQLPQSHIKNNESTPTAEKHSTATKKPNISPLQTNQRTSMPPPNLKMGEPQKNQQVPAYKYAEVVRKRDERRLLQGVECMECRKFIDAVVASGACADRQSLVQQCSRHRQKFSEEVSTPDGFWDLSFADSQVKH